MPLPISVSIVSCNEEGNLARCLRSVEGLAREIVVVDSGSKDGTVAVAESFGAKVTHQAWLGYRDQKNVALGLCEEEWVLALDCDEELSPELRANVEAFFEEGLDKRFDGASFNRKVWFMGRWILHGDWYPDTKLRLFRREKAKWAGSPEHDYIELEGNNRTWLRGDLHHFSFPSINRYVEKINGFADVFLQRQVDAGKSWSLATNVFRPWWRFFRAYVIRRGFMDGFPGLWIAVATAFSAFVRYSRKYEDEVNEVKSEK
ncbi:glycosyltransferase family 2 protein [Phragmitibacter flavus]|uniref:Glycosyltransferase family 2 protein n=1 Tax=Phragmitibacter flavus TaxID=2576071 RepID=A0A5R8KCN6_9BACT|nr:glycosyltransferase family 2 protein [Phragmitibacter flavus]TLD70061.1 glycosyltransferase family 2 protein [Phragmitibacter flavus]